MFATLRQQLAPRLLPQLFQDVHVLVEMFGSPAHTGMRDPSQPRVAMARIVDAPGLHKESPSCDTALSHES